ncbi:MAG: hypothetical protein H6741_14225 [Alphaproteobacteria bacterium]|nr:hypothetical protein [Alphaproteobacteria bacterium]
MPLAPLLAFLAGCGVTAMALLFVVRRMATDLKQDHATQRGYLESRVAELELSASALALDADSLRRAVDVLRAENLELEDRLEIREEWVTLRDEQLARAERTLAKAKQHFSEMQRKLEGSKQQREEMSRQVESAEREARRESDALHREIERQAERMTALREGLRSLTLASTGEDVELPEDPIALVDLVATRVSAQNSSMAVISNENEVLKHEVGQLRRSLSATTRSYQSYKERTEAELDCYAGELSKRGQRLPEDLSTEVARAVARRQASEIQLRAARGEIDDLRTKLRFANKTITAMEAQLRESRREPVVPDMLSGLRSPSVPPDPSY